MVGEARPGMEARLGMEALPGTNFGRKVRPV